MPSSRRARLTPSISPTTVTPFPIATTRTEAGSMPSRSSSSAL
ncbi:hypothetical protein [Streptosporangium sp. NPDC049376]